MLRVLLSVIILISACALHAQRQPVQLGKTASDCIGALMINDTIVGPVYSPPGYGNKLEFYGYELGDPFFIQREHNTVWYKFRAPYDAVLSLDIIPEVKEDDFDFLLFQYDGPNFCKQVAEGTKIPVRTNISRKNVFIDGRTGLSESAVDDYVPSGPGSSYSRAIKADAGDVYYMLVDNPFRENKGHSVRLSWRKINRGTADKSWEAFAAENTYVPQSKKLKVSVIDAESKERIAADIHVEGLAADAISHFPSVSQASMDVVSYRTYEINVVKKGYLLAAQSFIPKNDSLYELSIPIKKMKKGDRINLANIQFDSDKTEILDKSKTALDQLGAFIQANPEMHIQIQGHVNGEGKRNKRKYKKLSEARARAIYDKLVERGVDAARISYQGFGNAKMLFPTPVNNRQAEANRRVEAEVTKL